MKRILLLSLVFGFFASEVYAQQQSSRRTRQIAPRVAQKASTADTLKLQAEQEEQAADSPFEDYVEEPGALTPVLQAPQNSIPADSSAFALNGDVTTQAAETMPEAQLNAPNFEIGQPAASEINRQSHYSIATQLIAPAEINVGQATEIRLIATNDGQQEIGAFNIMLHLPSGVEFTRAAPVATDRTADMLAWRVEGLAAGQQKEITFELLPQTKQPMLLRTEMSFVDRQELEIAVRQPDVRMTVQSMAKAIVDQPIEHRMTIWNEGDGTAEGLELQVALPEGMQMVGELDTVQIGGLAPGESREITLQTRTSKPGVQPLNWGLAGTGVDVNAVSQVAVIWPELYAELLGPRMNIPHRDGTYTINLKNPCDIDLNQTQIILQIPTGMEITLLSREGLLDEKQRTLTWDMGTLASGDGESLQFKARLTGNQDQKCQVMVQSLETESRMLALETRAYIHTELKLAMKNTSGPVSIGDTAEFVIVASNTGQIDAAGVDVQVEFPQWLSPVEDSSYAIDRQNSRIVFQSVDIPQGMSAEFKFTGKCENAGNFVVRSFLNHTSQAQPMISDASLFVLDMQQEKVGSVITPEKEVR